MPLKVKAHGHQILIKNCILIVIMELATISEIKCLRYLELMKVVVVNNFLKTFYVNNQCDTDQFQV